MCSILVLLLLYLSLLELRRNNLSFFLATNSIQTMVMSSILLLSVIFSFLVLFLPIRLQFDLDYESIEALVWQKRELILFEPKLLSFSLNTKYENLLFTTDDRHSGESK